MRRMVMRLCSAAMLARDGGGAGQRPRAPVPALTLPQGSDPLTLDPAGFVGRIDNPTGRWRRAPGGATARPTRRATP